MANYPAWAQAIMTMRTAVEVDMLLVLVAANRDPAADPELRARLIAANNAAGFEWTHADEEGVHHGREGDALRPVRIRTGLITWAHLWSCIGHNITAERVAELRAAVAAGVELRAKRGPGLDQRLHSAVCAFFSSPRVQVPATTEPLGQLVLFDLVGAA